MTKIEKILVGVMAAIVLAVLGLAFTSFKPATQVAGNSVDKVLPYTNINVTINGKDVNVTTGENSAPISDSGTLGAVETAPTYLAADVTRQNDTYMYGGLEVAGTSYLRGTVNFSGDTRASTFVQTGSIATFTVTSTATAANVCDSRYWTLTAVTTTPTITLPSTSTLFADCLTTNGDSVSISLYNASAATSTIIAAGTGGTLLNSSSATIAATKGAVLTIVRDSATTVKAFLINAVN